MSRVRTGHGPGDWDVLPPFESPLGVGIRSWGGTRIEARIPPDITMPTLAEQERNRRRNEARRAAKGRL